MAPTITIPWIAFVPDMSGVCSRGGTFEITSKPRKIASTRIVSSIRNEGSLTPSPPSGHTGAGSDLVLEVEHQLAVRAQVLEHGGDVAGVELARVVRHRGGEVRRSRRSSRPHARPPRRARSARSCRLPPPRDRRSPTPGASHDRTRRNELRRGPAGDECGRDHGVELSGICSARASCCLRLLLVRELAARSRLPSLRHGLRGPGRSRRGSRPAPGRPAERRTR